MRWSRNIPVSPSIDLGDSNGRSILSKVALVIRVMSLFTVGAGIVVLTSTIWSGRYQRLRKAFCFAHGRVARKSGKSFAPVFPAGPFASATGIILAVGSSWALASSFSN
jgi:hypothetical protein